MSNVNLSIYNEMMGEVVSNLKNEIKELTFKVQKAREDENWGTYKNLILAYKEIIKLYKEIVDEVSKTEENKTQHIKNNMTISLDKNTFELIDEAFVRKKVAIDNKKDMYIDIGRDKCIVCCDGKIFYIDTNGLKFSNIIEVISSRFGNFEDKNIFIDKRGIGMGLVDAFDDKGVQYTDIEILK